MLDGWVSTQCFFRRCTPLSRFSRILTRYAHSLRFQFDMAPTCLTNLALPVHAALLASLSLIFALCIFHQSDFYPLAFFPSFTAENIPLSDCSCLHSASHPCCFQFPFAVRLLGRSTSFFSLHLLSHAYFLLSGFSFIFITARASTLPYPVN